jgi:hypothetical protein
MIRSFCGRGISLRVLSSNQSYSALLSYVLFLPREMARVLKTEMVLVVQIGLQKFLSENTSPLPPPLDTSLSPSRTYAGSGST